MDFCAHLSEDLFIAKHNIITTIIISRKQQVEGRLSFLVVIVILPSNNYVETSTVVLRNGG